MLIPWLLGAHGWDWRAVWVVLGALGLLAQLLVELIESGYGLDEEQTQTAMDAEPLAVRTETVLV